MSASDRMAKALRLVLPGGALGASLVLGLASSSAEARPSAAPAAADANVAGRLQAIRDGVTEIAQSAAQGTAAPPQAADTGVIPTWWGNGGWGRWHPGWHNGPFGWPNWHNWGNGWHNWGNGWNNNWHNFWHNW